MRYLNKITSDAYQRFNLIGISGERIVMTLRFMPSQGNWMMDIEATDFTVFGIHIVTSPNILRCFKNIITFGIACTTTDGLDPYYATDFAEQRCMLYLLNADEVKQVEEIYYT